MKKILLLFTVAIIFFYPIQTTYEIQKANAAVAGKVVNVGAKKVAKEIVKEITWNMTMDMVIDYKYTPKENQKPAKPGFELVCFPTDRNADGHCGRPIEIKKNLTSADKQTINSKIETVLDKKITSGKGMPKWAKLLDWLIPISTAAMGITLLDYAINSDVASLFDEMAYEALVEAGIIVPPELTDEDIIGGSDPNLSITYSQRSGSAFDLSIYARNCSGNCLEVTTPSGKTEAYGVKYLVSNERVYVVIDGKGYENFHNAFKDEKEFKDWYSSTSSAGILGRLYSLAKTSPVNVRFKGSTHVDPTPTTVPTFDEAAIGSNFVPNQPIKIINPNALPMKETTTGIPVKPQKQEDGSIIYIKETPTGPVPVPEDDITVEDAIITEGEPIVVENPDGTTTIKPGPSTVTNPNLPPGEEPNATLPPIGTPPETTPTFPEGEGCEESLKLPKIGPLFNQMSQSFPFSIPWDLKSGFDAVFEKMGSEKPSFKWKVGTGGHEGVEGTTIDITIPSYFDKWMPFIHSVFLLIFDIGILYGIYRLIQGGGGG